MTEEYLKAEKELNAHSKLVAAAAKWLKRKCAVVITELNTIGETPDAIGWQGTHSTLIECKVSRADFLADRSKFFRREPWMGIGMHRYYMAPSGLLTIDDLPPKWGLLELADDHISVTKKSEHFEETNSRHEIGILLSTLRRVGCDAPKAVSIRCYTIESKNTATLGLREEDSSLELSMPYDTSKCHWVSDANVPGGRVWMPKCYGGNMAMEEGCSCGTNTTLG